MIDNNPIKAYKKIFNKAFEFSDLVRAPPQYVHMNGIHLKLASHAKIHILSTNETPPKSQHPWSATSMWKHHKITRDAIWHVKHTSKHKSSAAATDWSDRSTPASTRLDRSDRSPLTGQTGHRLPEQPKAETKDITSLKKFHTIIKIPYVFKTW